MARRLPEQCELLDACATERDFQALAWQRMRRHAQAGTLQHMGLDAALAHPRVGAVLRAFAAQLRHQNDRDRAERQRAERWGQRVQSNGYGMRPVPRKA